MYNTKIYLIYKHNNNFFLIIIIIMKTIFIFRQKIKERKRYIKLNLSVYCTGYRLAKM